MIKIDNERLKKSEEMRFNENEWEHRLEREGEISQMRVRERARSCERERKRN